MGKPTPEFSMDDLVAEVNKQLETTEEGLTTQELCVAVGLLPLKSNMTRMYNVIRDMVVLGQVECVGRKRVKKLTGGWTAVPAYALAKEEGGDVK